MERNWVEQAAKDLCDWLESLPYKDEESIAEAIQDMEVGETIMINKVPYYVMMKTADGYRALTTWLH